MRVLIVSPYFPPQPAVASLRLYALARAWADAGEEITVLTTAKRDDQGGIERSFEGFRVEELPFRLPRVLERLRASHRRADPSAASATAAPRASRLLPLHRWRERSGVFASVRMPDLTDWWVQPAIRRARQLASAHGPWDIVYSSSGPYTAHLVAMAIHRLQLARHWAAEFRDLWTENQPFRGVFPFTIIERRREKQCLREADLIVTVSEGLRDELRRDARAPVEVIYNGFDDLHSTPSTRPSANSTNDLTRIVFTGTIYRAAQDPSPLFHAIAHLRERHPTLAKRLRITVAGGNGDVWRDFADRAGAADVLDFRGLLPREEAIALQHAAQALLLLDWNTRHDGILTTKVFEYLAASAPIVLIGTRRESELARLISRADRGVHLGDDPRSIAEALARLLQPAASAFTGDRSFIATLSRAHQSERLLEHLRALHAG